MAKRLTNYLSSLNSAQLMEMGRLVAEEDERLIEYYIGRDRYVDRAMSFTDPAVFFVGPKGIGKSAILQMIRLSRKSEALRIINISPDDLAFSALANVEATTPLLENAGKNQWLFKTLWDYVLALETLKREYTGKIAILDKIAALFRGKHDAEAKRLVEISLSDDGATHTLSERILQLVKEVEISGESHGVKLAGTVQLEHPERQEHLTLLAMVNSVARSLPTLLSHQYYVLIDDLDRYWNNTPVQNAFLAALFESLRKLNSSRSLKFVVAMRERIYRSLPLDDKDKVRDWVCKVDWDLAAVSKMIERRVSIALNCDEEEVWGGVFPAGSNETLWRRTTGKPREIIRLVAKCLAVAHGYGHRSVEQGDIGIAVLQFSEEKIEDLASELNYMYRGFDAFAKKMTGWPKEFPLEKILELAIDLSYELQRERNRPAYEWAGVYESDVEGLARILLETGLLRFKHNRTAPAEDFSADNPVEITKEFWFAVHPMYSSGLKCVGDTGNG